MTDPTPADFVRYAIYSTGKHPVMMSKIFNTEAQAERYLESRPDRDELVIREFVG